MHASTGGAVCNSSGARLHASGVGSSLAAPQNTKKTGQLSEEQKKRPINRYTTNNTKKQTQMIFQQIYRGEKSDTDGAPWTCPTAKKCRTKKKKIPRERTSTSFHRDVEGWLLHTRYTVEQEDIGHVPENKKRALRHKRQRKRNDRNVFSQAHCARNLGHAQKTTLSKAKDATTWHHFNLCCLR